MIDCRTSANQFTQLHGILHQIFRPKMGESGFFVAGNYPHQRPDGLFSIGEKWGWAANTMLREHALWSAAGDRHGRTVWL